MNQISKILNIYVTGYPNKWINGGLYSDNQRIFLQLEGWAADPSVKEPELAAAIDSAVKVIADNVAWKETNQPLLEEWARQL